MIRDDGFSFAELPFIVPHSLATTQKAVRHNAAPTGSIGAEYGISTISARKAK